MLRRARKAAREVVAQVSALARVAEREVNDKRKRDARRPDPPVLTTSNTRWIFLSNSFEPRHLLDIVWAVDSLRARGCPDASIRVYTSAPPVAKVLFDSYGIVGSDLADVGAELATLQGCRFAVLTVGGHGTPTGIGAGLSPARLLAALRAVPEIDVGIAVLCQCFAGAFHFIDAKREPPLVVFGATNLNLSVSARIRLSRPLKQVDGSDGAQAWNANFFMFKFFEWVRNPRDIDGDGVVNLVDAFKHAGVESSLALTNIKGALFVEANRLASEVAKLTQAGAAPLEITAAQTLLQQALITLHVHQEPWILHADLARSLRF